MTSSLDREILSRGLDDLIQLAEIVSVAVYVIGVTSTAEVKSEVLNCVRDLITADLALVGDARNRDGKTVFEPWNGDPDHFLSRIQEQWNSLSRDPGLGEICWLQLTKRGRSLAEELGQESSWLQRE